MTTLPDVVPGQLRLSKGAWLFRPEALDVLWRVQPAPAPSPEGFFSQDVKARLRVKPLAVHRGGGSSMIAPRTGVPDELCGVVSAHEGDDLVVDAGIPVIVVGAARGGPAVGERVRIELDVDSGIRCEM